MNLIEITDGELLVMKCLWDEDRPMSVEEIIQALKIKFQKDNKYTAIYTFLSRLREKGYVDSYKKGTSYYYYLVSQEEFLRNYTETLNNFWGDDAKKMLLAAFVQKQSCSEQKRRKIQELIDKMDFFRDLVLGLFLKNT